MKIVFVFSSISKSQGSNLGLKPSWRIQQNPVGVSMHAINVFWKWKSTLLHILRIYEDMIKLRPANILETVPLHKWVDAVNMLTSFVHLNHQNSNLKLLKICWFEHFAFTAFNVQRPKIHSPTIWIYRSDKLFEWFSLYFTAGSSIFAAKHAIIGEMKLHWSFWRRDGTVKHPSLSLLGCDLEISIPGLYQQTLPSKWFVVDCITQFLSIISTAFNKEAILDLRQNRG